jgi:PP-loop superfamily ATP-utilizing enzyme
MAADNDDFDVIFVGGLNATALAKFAQQDLGDKKMAIISDKNKFLIP